MLDSLLRRTVARVLDRKGVSDIKSTREAPRPCPSCGSRQLEFRAKYMTWQRESAALLIRACTRCWRVSWRDADDPEAASGELLLKSTLRRRHKAMLLLLVLATFSRRRRR